MQYIIFGAGNNSTKLIEQIIANKLEINYLVDNDVQKWGSQILGYMVKAVSELSIANKKTNHILISVTDKVVYDQISRQLTSMGFIEGTDFSNGLQLFNISEIPSGKVSGYLELPKDFYSIKTFDTASRLITLKKEHRIFRFVNESYIGQYRETYRICSENKLFGNYVIDTVIAENKWDLPFTLILEHHYIEPITYCFEWAPGMFIEYVSFMINMIKRFAELGLALCDGHTLNATISDGNFIFIDFGAIQPGVTNGNVLMEFLNTHMIPLILMCKNQISKAYLYLKNPGIEYTVADIQGYLNRDELSKLQALYGSLVKIKVAEDIYRFVFQVSDFIKNINKQKYQTRWFGYQNDEWEWSSDISKWSTKMHSVVEMINFVNPNTVVDLAGNMGWYGACLHDQLKYAIIADYDYNCLDYLWKRIKTFDKHNIIPAYMSICAPTLDYYRDEGIGTTAIEPWRKSAVERFKSDLVIALAVVHHLAFAQQLTFGEIIGQFALFSNKYLIVEFIEQTDQFITDFLKKGFEWYTKDNFEAELQSFFKIIKTKPSTPCETRTLYLCKLK